MLLETFESFFAALKLLSGLVATDEVNGQRIALNS
jgi:hypothetical protein